MIEYWTITKIDFKIDYDEYYSMLAMRVFEHDISLICSQDQWQVKGYTPEDLAQEVRLQLWRKLPLYNPTKASLRTWANRVIKNRIRNLMKASGRQKREIQFYLTELKEDI